MTRPSLVREIIGGIEALGGRVRCRDGKVEVAGEVPRHLIDALRSEAAAEVARYLSARAVSRRAHELRLAEAAAAEVEPVPPGWMIANFGR